MFEIIDEKLRLASCSLSDLTMQQVHDFLGEWKGGWSIGSLTLFYDEDRNMVVLNRDREDYKDYLEVASRFMRLDAGQREEVLKNPPKSMKHTMEVLNGAVKKIKYRQELDLLRLQPIPSKYANMIQYIRLKEKSDCFALMFIFMYGVICGKREERARRKKEGYEKV